MSAENDDAKGEYDISLYENALTHWNEVRTFKRKMRPIDWVLAILVIG